MNLDENNTKRKEYQLKYILRWIMKKKKQKLTRHTIKHKSEQKARDVMDNLNKIESKK